MSTPETMGHLMFSAVEQCCDDEVAVPDTHLPVMRAVSYHAATMSM